MNDEKELLGLEEEFWRGGADFYRTNVTDEALMVFAEPVGVLDKAQAVESIASAPRWSDVRFEGAKVVRLSNDAALLTYKATARRDGDAAPYVTLASSVYVVRAGGRKLAFHQQTPTSAS